MDRRHTTVPPIAAPTTKPPRIPSTGTHVKTWDEDPALGAVATDGSMSVTVPFTFSTWYGADAAEPIPHRGVGHTLAASLST
jgi:hypothetical protein